MINSTNLSAKAEQAQNVMWLLSVGGRACAGRNGDLQEGC